MKPFQKILVPIDFSAHSREATRVAADVAKRYDAQLTLVHVYEPIAYALPDGFMLWTPNQTANLLTEYQRLLDAAKAEAQADGAPAVQTAQLQGMTAAEIVAHAKKEGSDLIVMGTHGRKGIAHAVLGSVTERVVRSAPCPVLTVRGKGE